MIKTQILFFVLMPILMCIVAQAQEKTKAPQIVQKAEEPNARLELARAAKLMFESEKFGKKQSLESERQLVAENARALEVLRGALTMQFRAEPFPHQTEDIVDAMSENFKAKAQYRSMVRLLVTESRVRAADKDFAGAVQSALDAQRLSLLIQSGGILIDMLTGQATDGVARQQLRVLLPQLDSAALKVALQVMQRNALLQPAYAQILQNEAAWSWVEYQKLTEDTPKAHAQAMRVEWQRLMAWQIAQARVPYIASEQHARGNDIFENLADLDAPIPNDITKTHLPALVEKQFAFQRDLYSRSRLIFENNLTQDALLLVDFALRAYELEHQKPATSWNELVPNYLQQSLNDPFDYEHLLRLATRAEKPVAYSIGPDGLDDKGAEIDGGEAMGTRRFRVEADSRGDIVSGINVQ